MQSQNQLIKQHLQAGNSLTALQALTLFGCLRLSGRIHDLRHAENLPIKSEMVKINGKHIARYSL